MFNFKKNMPIAVNRNIYRAVTRPNFLRSTSGNTQKVEKLFFRSNGAKLAH